uniref:Aspartic proteinase nepenthesin-2 n=1 Tax=Aegilops tauschii TaxID=37682 RepID=M8C7W9_AEGTA
MEITASTLLLLIAGVLVHALPTICTTVGGLSLPLVANHDEGTYRVDNDGVVVHELPPPSIPDAPLGVHVRRGHRRRHGPRQRGLLPRAGHGQQPDVDAMRALLAGAPATRPGHDQRRHGFISFGADIPEPPPLDHHHIKILPTPQHLPHGVADSAYYVKLLGISLNGSPIRGIQQTMFERQRDGSGGCFVDAGTQITHLVPAAYTPVEEAVARVLQQWGYKRVRDRDFHLCFREEPGIWSRIPRLTLDFEGPPTRHGEPTRAHLEIGSRHLFLKVDNEQLLCFGIYPTTTGHPTVIGAMQQVDTRFIFDLRANTITIHPESCEADTEPTPSEW